MKTRPDPPYVLAIDIGTSAVKAGMFDRHASAVGETVVTVPHQQRLGADGTSEEPAEAILLATEQAVDGVLAAARSLGLEVAAVAADSMAGTMLGIDDAGLPVTPVYTYADTRSASDVQRLLSDLDVPAVYQRTGCPQHTAYGPARVLWLRRADPIRASRVRRWSDVSTWIYSRWFDKRDVPASYSVSSWSGMLNRHDLSWDRVLLDYLGLDEDDLPPLAEYREGIQGLSPGYRRRWPGLRDKPFYLAVGDGAAVNVGAGCVGPKRVALTVGTTGAMRVLLSEPGPKVPEGLWAYRLGRDLTLLGGSFSEGGNVIRWAMDTLRLPDFESLDGELCALEPDEHGLTILPFLSGERSTGWDPTARGVIHGLSLGTSPLNILQACMESIALRFALVWGLIEDSTGRDPMFVASGGALKASKYWLQVMADVLQRPITTSPESEDTSRGTAILALNALGAWSSLTDVPAEIDGVVQPDATKAAVYRAALERQKDLYARLVSA